MYKITILCPDHELLSPDAQDVLRAFDSKSATAMIINAKEDDDALKLIIGFCKMIAGGELQSLTVTKEDDSHKQTEV